MSVAKPDAAFHVGFAMMRNRYIYAQSEATVVVRADLTKVELGPGQWKI